MLYQTDSFNLLVHLQLPSIGKKKHYLLIYLNDKICKCNIYKMMSRKSRKYDHKPILKSKYNRSRFQLIIWRHFNNTTIILLLLFFLSIIMFTSSAGLITSIASLSQVTFGTLMIRYRFVDIFVSLFSLINRILFELIAVLRLA